MKLANVLLIMLLATGAYGADMEERKIKNITFHYEDGSYSVYAAHCSPIEVYNSLKEIVLAEPERREVAIEKAREVLKKCDSPPERK